MRKHLVVLVAAAAFVVPAPTATANHDPGDSGTHTASGEACPDESQNPEGTPPSCGNQHPNDRDGDGVSNQDDNCPDAANADQSDTDQDGVGDACDGDRDGDGFDNDEDNCPDAHNDQRNSDWDDLGDACDPDRDGDGFDNDQDNCPDAYNEGQSDLDHDGVGDACDEPIIESKCSGSFYASDGRTEGQTECTFLFTGEEVNLRGDASAALTEPCGTACWKIEVTLWTMNGVLLGSCSADEPDVNGKLTCYGLVTVGLPSGTPLLCRGHASGTGAFSCGSRSQT